MDSAAIRAPWPRASKSLAEIEDALRQADWSACEPLPIAVLRNVVVEPIAPYLRYLAYEIDHNATVRFGEYDQIVQEAVGGRPDLLNEATACVAVFAQLDVLSWDLARNFAALGPSQVKGEAERIGNFIDTVLAGIRRQTAAIVLWHSFELPLFPAFGIADSRLPDSHMGVVAELNERLRQALATRTGTYLVDLNTCRARLGSSAFYDDRYWHIGRAPYSREALREIALEDFKYLRALKGRQKKCLVLDCDDVLWGGIVGEDGPAGIKLSRTYPGSPYHELQQEVLNLHARGVILALCSKNNEADVWEVFRGHPDMLLREEHIAAARINWNDKPTSLREIASELNIALDSLVFVDDSEVECEIVRRVLPEVEVLHLPRDRAFEHRRRLAAGGWFDTLAVSEDDLKRGSRYRTEAARVQMRAQSPDLESYFESLEMAIQIRPADRLSVPRIAQLTQKTNQFNLTTRRYSEEDIARFAASDAFDVLGLRLADRYGDAGLVGVAVLFYDGPTMIVDSFLLSCRVLGRGVEDAFLVQCLKRAKANGACKAIGQFVATAKNHQVREFFQTRQFQPIGSQNGAERFEIDLAAFAGVEPAFFKDIDSAFEEPSRTEE